MKWSQKQKRIYSNFPIFKRNILSAIFKCSQTAEWIFDVILHYTFEHIGLFCFAHNRKKAKKALKFRNSGERNVWIYLDDLLCIEIKWLYELYDLYFSNKGKLLNKSSFSGTSNSKDLGSRCNYKRIFIAVCFGRFLAFVLKSWKYYISY